MPKKERRSLLDILLPVVDDGLPQKDGKGGEKEEASAEAAVPPVVSKKRNVPGSVDSGTGSVDESAIVLPRRASPDEEVFYKSILEKTAGSGESYDKFNAMLAQYVLMFPGAEEKAVQAALIPLGSDGPQVIAKAIEEKLGVLKELSDAFAEETKSRLDELVEQEKDLPKKDGEIVEIEKQISSLREQVEKQVLALQKRIEALNSQKEIVSRQVQEGKGKVATAQTAFNAALARVQSEFLSIKTKVISR